MAVCLIGLLTTYCGPLSPHVNHDVTLHGGATVYINVDNVAGYFRQYCQGVLGDSAGQSAIDTCTATQTTNFIDYMEGLK